MDVSASVVKSTKIAVVVYVEMLKDYCCVSDRGKVDEKPLLQLVSLVQVRLLDVTVQAVDSKLEVIQIRDAIQKDVYVVVVVCVESEV